jgi:HEAT repeat protein
MRIHLSPTGAAALAAALVAQMALANAPYPLAPLPGEAQAADILKTGLASKNPEIRKQAVVALSLAGVREPYLSWLEAMLTDSDVPVRVAAVSSLVDLKNPRTVPILRKALRDPAPEVSFAAAKALWTLEDPAGREALVAVLGRESKTSSNFVTAQMRETLRLLHMPKDLFLFAFKNGIGMVPVPGIGAGVSSLQAILSDSGVSGRAAAALLMANDPAPEVLVALHDALSDKDPTVRAAAVHALAVRGDPGTIETVRGLLDDMKEPVRFRAAAAYLRLAWIAQNHNPHSSPRTGVKAAPVRAAPAKK